MKLPLPEKPEGVSLFFFLRFYANTDLLTGSDWYDWQTVENIPPCGLFDFPDKEKLKFRFAPANEDFEVITLPLVAALGTMVPEDRYLLNPLRWHRVKEQLSTGEIEYPEMTLGLGRGITTPALQDGRHRIVAMMKLMGMVTAPFAVDPGHAETVRNFFNC